MLAQEPVQPPKLNLAQTVKAEVISQQSAQSLTPKPSMAPPESTAIEFLPLSLLEQPNGAQPQASSSPSSANSGSNPDESTNPQVSETWQQEQSANMEIFEAIRLGELPVVAESKIANTNDTSDKQPIAIQSQVQQKQPQILAQPQQNLKQNSVDSVQQRKQILAERLAEIVARDESTKTAKRRDNLIASSIEYANQGQFDLARQLIQDSAVPADMQQNILNRISELQAANAKLIAAQEAEKTRLAATQRRAIQARSPVGRTQSNLPTAMQPVQIGPFNLSDRGLGIGNTTPLGREYNGRAFVPPIPLGNGNASLIFPLPTPAPITSGFGWRVHPILGTQRFHKGVDIGAAEGTPVVAALSGKVTTADHLQGYGLSVVLEHSQGTQDSLYAHMSQVFVRPGEEVKQGAVIGRVGSTGMSTGPHLHFEFRQRTTDGWVNLDPGPQLKTALNQLVQALRTTQSATPDSQENG